MKFQKIGDQKQKCPRFCAGTNVTFEQGSKVHFTAVPTNISKKGESPSRNKAMEQIEAFIDMLGYLNILHPEDSFGVTAGHTCEKDMLLPLSDRGYVVYLYIKTSEVYNVLFY